MVFRNVIAKNLFSLLTNTFDVHMHISLRSCSFQSPTKNKSIYIASNCDKLECSEFLIHKMCTCWTIYFRYTFESKYLMQINVSIAIA